MTTYHADPALARPAGGEGGRLLRRGLRLDAASSGGLGAVLAAAAPALDGLLGAPIGLLLAAGVFLVAYAAGLWALSSRQVIPVPAVRAVLVTNLLWVSASVLLVLAGWVPLTTLGVAFVLVQAVAVAGLVELQVLGLRRGRPAAA